MNIYGCNTINSILSIRTYINTSIILLPTILLSLLSSSLFRVFQSLCIMITSCVHLDLSGLAEITFAGLILCSVITFPLAHFFSITNLFRLYSCFNLKLFERQQLYEIWPCMGSIIIRSFVYNPINSLSNLFCSTVHLNLDVETYGSFGPPFFLIESINSSQCVTSVYEAWSLFGDRTILLPFNTQWITTMNVVFGNSGRLPLTCLLARSPKSIAG